MKKRIISLVMALVMIISLMPWTVFATESTTPADPAVSTEPTAASTETTGATEAPTETTGETTAPTETTAATETTVVTEAATEAPTEATEATETPTEATEATEAPTEATEATETPTETTEATEAPTEATEVTETPTEATEATEAATEPTERVCLEGCILEGEAEHLENGGECLVWITCTLTEGCEGPNGHEGECYGAAVYAGTTITVSGSGTWVLYNSSTGAYYAASAVKSSDGGGWWPGQQQTTYTVTYTDIPAGTYILAKGTWGNSSYTYGSVTISDDGTATASSLESTRFTNDENMTANEKAAALSIYEARSSFDHVDIRVAGSYVIHVGSQTYTATVSNPSVTVKVGGTTVASKSWSGSTSYEWRQTGLRLYPNSGIEVDMTLDLTYTDSSGQRIVLDNVNIVYDNRNDLNKFLEAIIRCDGTQGFDFTVSVQDIQEVIEYHTVTYQWKVQNTDGSYTTLPAGAPSEPAATSGHEAGSAYTYDTEYVTGTSFYDYDKGLLYTFHGWDTYSHSSHYNVDPTAEGYTELDDGNTNAADNKIIPITADTYIYGYWTVTELAPASAHIAIEKKFIVDGQEVTMSEAEDLWFRIDTGIDRDGDNDTEIDVDYSMIQAATNGEYKIPVYQYDTPFVFTEHNADVPGYTRTTTIEVSGDYIADSIQNGDSVTVKMEPVYTGENIHLGTVTYTNTYTKNVGTSVSEYPELTLLKTASDTNSAQGGVIFTLNNEAGVVKTVTTDDSGIAYVDFTGLNAGTYYLKETTAAAGYVLDETAYPVTLTASDPVEELRDGKYVQVTYYTLSVVVPDGSGAVYTESRATNVYYRLHIYNDPIQGSLNVSKTINGLDDADKNKLNAVVIVHGPITRDSGNNITDIGSTWQLNLNSENGWKASLADLHLGEYLIHESMASVHGYIWDSVTYGGLDTVIYNNITSGVFEVNDTTAIELTLTNEYSKWTSADFYIKKVDPNGTALAGATFQLYTDATCTNEASGSFTTYAETLADGYAHFTGYTVPEGETSVTYYLKETKAPAGYYLSDTIYKVEIKAITTNGEPSYEPKITDVNGAEITNWDKTQDVLAVTNDPVKGVLTIKKIFDNGQPNGISSVNVTVQGPEGYTYTGVLNAPNWTLTLDNLTLGTYTVYEHNADVPGYTLTTTYKVSNTETNQVTLQESDPGNTSESVKFSGEITITNRYDQKTTTEVNPTNLVVKKVGENGELLPGAVFKLTSTRTGDSRTYTTGTNGTVIFDMLQGSLENGAPKENTYKLEEITAPEGYAKSDTTWIVTVEEDNGQVRIELNEDQNIFENIWDWIVGGVTGEQDNYTFATATENTPATLTVKNVELADLTITKSFNGVNAPDGAVIEVTILDGEGNFYQEVELTAAEGWTAAVENLPAGQYTVMEGSASLHGYTWTGADMQVTGATSTAGTNSVTINVVDSADISLAITNNYTVWTSADFWVFKTKDDGHTPLAGATFELYSDAALTQNVTETYLESGTSNTTGTTGMVHFQGFKNAATFYLKETKAPANYYGDDTVYKVTVSHDGGYDITITDKDGKEVSFNHSNDTLTVKNTEILGDLTITKSFGGGNDLVPNSVAVKVTGQNYNKTVYLTAANNWTVTLNNLHLGKYTVQEQNAEVAGYDLDVKYDGKDADKAEVTLTATDAEVEIENTYDQNVNRVDNPASFTVKKVDENGNALAGAKFGLYDSNGDLVGTTQTTGKDGIVTFGPFQSAATYTLKEVQAPNNYRPTKTTWTVEVKLKNGDPTIELSADGSVFNKIYNWIVGINDSSWNGQTLTVENEKMVGDITITKSFVGGDGQTITPPKGAVIEVTILDGNGKFYREVELTEENNWKYTVRNLPAGKYTVAETIASLHGYSWIGAEIDVSGASFTEGTNSVTVNVQDNAAVKLDITNSYTVWDAVDFWVFKTKDDGHTPLAGAQFTLYNASNQDVTEKYLDKSVTSTNETGVYGDLHFQNFKVAEGQTAIFYLKETKAPANYKAAGITYKVIITHDSAGYDITITDQDGKAISDFNHADDVLTVRNTQILGDLTIRKNVTDAQGFYSDAVYSFTLDCSDDTFDQTFTLKAGESKTIENIPWGTTYTVTEDTTGAAYISAITDSGNGVIGADETMVTVTNTYNYVVNNPGLNLVKVDSDTGAAIAGAEFALYSDVACETLVTSGKTGADGSLHLDIPYTASVAKYYLKETKPAEGYHPNESVYVVTATAQNVVKNGGTSDAFTEKQLMVTVAGLGEAVADDSNTIRYTYTVENTAIKAVEVSVEKVWNDGGYHARPAEVEATLLRDNEAYATVTLNADNEWSHTWTGLTDEYSWSVDEANVPDEYAKSVTNEGDNWTITNTRTAKPVEITVTKAWKHNGGKDLPESIAVTLYRDGESYETVTLSEANGWTYTWKDLTDVSVWSVDETEVPTGYTKEITADGYTFQITNTRIIQPVTVSVNKVWTVAEGVTHPTSVEAVLYRDGKAYDTVTLNEKNDWSHTWKDLTDEYTWNVDEKDVPAGYTKNVTNDGTNFTITNTKNFKDIEVSVSKVWYGSDVTHPTSVKVTLYRDGKAYDTVTLNEKNDWSYTWKDLTDEFEWEVDEPSVPSGYNKTVRQSGYSFTITNTYEDIPLTGDESLLGMWAVLALLAAAGVVLTGTKMRKKSK